MFRPVYSGSLRTILPRTRVKLIANFSSSPITSADQPNEPLQLDPSYTDLLRDVDISLLKNKQNPHSAVRDPPKELETFSNELEGGISASMDEGTDVGEDYHAGLRDARKSPAALFGSQSIGQVVLPLELQNSINLLISGELHIRRHFIIPSALNYLRNKNQIKRCSTAMLDVFSSKNRPTLSEAKRKQNRHGKQNTSSKNTNPSNRPIDTQSEMALLLRP